MDRAEFESLLSELKEIKVYNIDSDDDGGVLDKLFNELNAIIVASELNIDKHRWYELSTTVIRVGDFFIGARGVSQMYSESSTYADIGIYLKFFEVERKEITAYEYSEIK